MKTMMNKYELKRTLLDVFFPNRCPVCNKVIGRMDYICDRCADSFVYDNKQYSLCGRPLLCVCRYNNKTMPVVIGAKKHRDGSKLSFMAYTVMQKIIAHYDTLPDVLLPVPVHTSDKIRKGYSHIEKVCREISEITGIPTVNAVAKTRKTAQQKTLSKDERQKNLHDCFSVTDKQALKGKHVLIIDDVMTTGSTLTEVYNTIADCGCSAIDFAVFAKV